MRQQDSDARELAEVVSKELGLPIVDSFYFLIRLGDFSGYSFRWEPFRDLAGPLEPSESSRPIVVICDPSQGSGVSIVEAREPRPHLRFVVGPMTQAAAVTSAWLSLLVREGALKTYLDPADWFLAGLGLTPGEMLREHLQFLHLDRPSAARDLVFALMGHEPDQVRDTGYALIEEFGKLGFHAPLHGPVTLAELGAADVFEPESKADRVVVYAVGNLAAGGGLEGIATTLSRHARRLLLVIDGPVSHREDAVLTEAGVESFAVIWLEGGPAPPALGTSLLHLLQMDELGGTWADFVERLQQRLAGGRVELAVHGDPTAFIGPRPLSSSPARLLGGYSNDDPYGEDRLGIQGEVNMLCSVVATPTVVPPLSIGLFGPWGAGKSFFMQKMMERIEEITTGDPGTGPVLQIRFNAWHYMDTNLWASLAVEIFERIIEPEPVKPAARASWEVEDAEARQQKRAALLDRLSLFQHVIEELEARRRDAAGRRKEASTDLQKATEARQSAAEALGTVRGVDIVSEVLADPEVAELRANAEKELGIEVPWSDVSSLASDLRRASGSAVAVWRRAQVGGAIVFAVAALAVAVVLPLALAASGSWRLSALVPLVAGIGAFGKAARELRPAAASVRRGLAALERSMVAAEAKERERRTEQTKDEVEAETRLQAAEATQRKLETAVAEATADLHDAERELRDLREGRRLYEFLAERAADYRRQLGLIGHLRQDFLMLDRHLRAARDDARALGALDRVERIVLYIDDLDRCPPHRVVEVLQAVHLLMALPLFVVVVGVDPRWLRRSLEYEYRRLIRAGRDDRSWIDLPQEYLEKIFQVPFTLPEMTPGGFAALLQSFVPESEDAEGQVVVPVQAPPGHVDPMGPATGHVRRGAIEVEAGSAATDTGQMPGDALDLTLAEIEFASRLAALVPSPRAVKRLMNSYRMLRSTRYTGSTSDFLAVDGGTGAFQAVLQLLGVASGFVSLADDLFIGLDSTVALTWRDFVADLEPVPAGRGFSNTVAGSLGDTADNWRRLHHALAGILASTPVLDDLDTYQQWMPRVARFSFSL